MKRLLVSLALVCALASAVAAGDPHDPGSPAPLPTPCPAGQTCSSAVSSGGDVRAVIVRGVLFIFSLR
jgi:hypothetical protein